MRLVVCGGAGFIGSAFVRQMLDSHPDWSIRVLDKLTYAGNLDNLPMLGDEPRLTFARTDIADAAAVRDELVGFGAVDAIVNFAAETHVDRSIADSRSFLETDVLGVHVLLEAVREHGINRLVHVSTDEVYGPAVAGSFTEAATMKPTSPYAASKAGGDLQALASFATYGTPVVITRGSNTYGPNQHPEKLVPLFITNGLEGTRLPLYGDGLNVRDWLHVSDHARGVEAALLRGEPGEIYNIGGGHELTNRELTECVLGELGLNWDEAVSFVTDRPGHDRRYSIDCSKARERLGWTPVVDFGEGMRETVAWYRENPEWWARVKHSEDFEAWVERWYVEREARA